MLKFVGWINKEAKQILGLPLAASTLLSMAVSPLCMAVDQLTMVGQVPRIGPSCHRPMLRASTTHRLPLQCSAWQTREVGSEWNGCASTYSPNWLLAQAPAAVKEKPTNNSNSRQRRPLCLLHLTIKSDTWANGVEWPGLQSSLWAGSRHPIPAIHGSSRLSRIAKGRACRLRSRVTLSWLSKLNTLDCKLYGCSLTEPCRQQSFLGYHSHKHHSSVHCSL